jgi:carboxyl-terminal processing protease
MLMPAKAFEQMTIDTQGKFGGVGIIVSQERGKIIVVSPIEDTPAHKAGVKAGDEIIEIDDQPVSKFKNSDAVDSMRGEPGSLMKITIVRKDVKEPLKFKLVREIVKVKSVRGQMLEDSTLYARISSFQENTADELEALIQKHNPEKLSGMILDLRDNPGGLLDQAVAVTDLFIESGIIVSTVGRDKDRIEREFARKRGTIATFPIVVLVNGGSASASEIVAGALQDHERALLVGTTTFGKGSVQTLMSLPDGRGLKLTVARYYTPKDRSIQAKGIRPDVIVSDKNSVETHAGCPEPGIYSSVYGQMCSTFHRKPRLLHVYGFRR